MPLCTDYLHFYTLYTPGRVSKKKTAKNICQNCVLTPTKPMMMEREGERAGGWGGADGEQGGNEGPPSWLEKQEEEVFMVLPYTPLSLPSTSVD